MTTPTSDLTRWNRAGLRRFRYVNANAATLLEELRRHLADRFPNRSTVDIDTNESETASERLTRILAQYTHHTGALDRELERTFVRACHVLTEHVDAYANEGFLRTATQWENVRRSVELLDYRPKPPASATTYLALIAKDGEQGTVAKGFQVQHTPKDGGEPIIFETLEDVDIDWRHAQIILRDDKRLEMDWNPLATEIYTEDLHFSTGQIVIAERTDQPEASVLVLDHVDPKNRLVLRDESSSNNLWRGWTLKNTQLLVRPKIIRRPKLDSPRTLHFKKPHGLSAGSVIAWTENGNWQSAVVAEQDATSIRLRNAPPTEQLPDASDTIYHALPYESGPHGLIFPKDSKATLLQKPDGLVPIDPIGPSKDKFPDFPKPQSDDPPSSVRYEGDDADVAFIVPKDGLPIGDLERVGMIALNRFQFDGRPGDLASGQWLVAETDTEVGTVRHAVKIVELIEKDDHFELILSNLNEEQHLARLHGPFQHTLVPNPPSTPIYFTKDEHNHVVLPIGPNAHSETLKVGRKVILERTDDVEASQNRLATIEAADASSLKLANITPPIPPSENASHGYTYENTVVRTDIVLAGHGETSESTSLGSGDAGQPNQSFVFEQENISFVSDPSQATGVRADIVITVGEQIWQQVSTLNDVQPTDPFYTVRLTEEGLTKLTFGDGVHGRRLPSGSNNIQIAYRTGVGEKGNLPPGSLNKAVKPHILIDSVKQPLDAAGGRDLESVTSIQRDGVASSLTLRRAVSLPDFAKLATSHASVSQAHATRRPMRGNRRAVEVFVEPDPGTGSTLR